MIFFVCLFLHGWESNQCNPLDLAHTKKPDIRGVGRVKQIDLCRQIYMRACP